MTTELSDWRAGYGVLDAFQVAVRFAALRSGRRKPSCKRRANAQVPLFATGFA